MPLPWFDGNMLIVSIGEDHEAGVSLSISLNGRESWRAPA